MNKPDSPETGNQKRYHLFLRLFFWVISVPFTGWAVVAIYWSDLPEPNWPVVCAGLFGVLASSIFFWVKSFKQGLVIYGIAFGAVVIWWWRIPASNSRQWQPMSDVLCYADINGDDITIHNIRNYDFTSETDFTPRYYDKTVCLTDLKTVDLYLNFWGPTLIAHTMMSFGFGDDGYICISIETRKEKGEGYSAIKGFFKQFELLYVVGDERDLVRWRTHVKNEDVYLYRLNSEPQVIRSVFLDYFKQINKLNKKAKWYNALTHNCTTTIKGHTEAYTHDKIFDWRLIVNGFLDEMLYEHNRVDTSIPFEELKKRVNINEKALKWDGDQDFSAFIREGLPGMERD